MLKKITTALTAVTALASHQGFAEMKIIELEQDEEETCGAEDWQTYVGEAYDQVPADLIAGVDHLRLIYPDSLITMDFRLDRLNIYINDEGLITRIRCG